MSLIYFSIIIYRMDVIGLPYASIQSTEVCGIISLFEGLNK